MKRLQVLSLLAVSAISATVFASTASAAEFEAGEGGKTISATTLNQHVLKLTGSEVKCGTTKFEGTTEAEANESLRLHPVYESCEAFGFSSGVSVTTKGCDFEFNANTSSGMGTLKIVDHAGETCNGIAITADPPFTTCTAVIPKQTISGAASYTNNSGKIRIKATATGVEVNVTASTGLCPLTTGLHSGASGASFNGESELSAAGTTIGWFAAPPVPPTFGVYNKPAGLHWAVGETKQMKVEDEGAAGENWTLRGVGLLQTGGNWEESEQANCFNKAVNGGAGFKCEWKVKCKAAGNLAFVIVFWTNMANRKGESFYGPIECP